MISQIRLEWMAWAAGAVLAVTSVAVADEAGLKVETDAAPSEEVTEAAEAGEGEAAVDDRLLQFDAADLVAELGADHAAKRNAAGEEIECRFVYGGDRVKALVDGDDPIKGLVDELLDCYQHSNDPEQWERARESLVLWVTKYSDFGPNYGFLGVQHRLVIFPTSDGVIQHAVRVDRVVENAAADKAGLKVGDRILKIDGANLNTSYGDLTFYRYIFNRGGGREVKLKVLRAGEGEIDLSAVLGRQRREHFRGLNKESRSANELFLDWLDSRDVDPR